MKMFVKPLKKDSVLRDPKTRRPLPQEGGFVEVCSFWLRRLDDGDIEKVHVENKEKFIEEMKAKKVKAQHGNKKEQEKKNENHDKNINGGV